MFYILCANIVLRGISKSWIKCSLSSCNIKFLVRLDTSVSRLSISCKSSFSVSLKIFLVSFLSLEYRLVYKIGRQYISYDTTKLFKSMHARGFELRSRTFGCKSWPEFLKGMLYYFLLRIFIIFSINTATCFGQITASWKNYYVFCIVNAIHR